MSQWNDTEQIDKLSELVMIEVKRIQDNICNTHERTILYDKLDIYFNILRELELLKVMV